MLGYWLYKKSSAELKPKGWPCPPLPAQASRREGRGAASPRRASGRDGAATGQPISGLVGSQSQQKLGAGLLVAGWQGGGTPETTFPSPSSASLALWGKGEEVTSW